MKRIDPDKYFKTVMHRTRQDLSPIDRTLSKLLRSPFLAFVSEVANKTLFRPVSLLTAAITTVSGLFLVYYLARFTGFTLSGSELPLLFCSGYLVGIIIELLISVTKFRDNKEPSHQL